MNYFIIVILLNIAPVIIIAISIYKIRKHNRRLRELREKIFGGIDKILE